MEKAGLLFSVAGWQPVSYTHLVDGTQADSLFRMKKHWEYQEQPLTRYFGGLTREFQTDVGTLARGLSLIHI